MNLVVFLSVVILSYDPAPGQFINILPAVTDNPVTAAQNALDRGMLVSLGAAGGSLTAAFSSPVANTHDYDIAIFGNAFAASAEPGIVYVSKDINHNNLPDDPWYEIAGSEYANTIHNYTITYYRPANDTSNIAYEDSEGNTGYVFHNTFHSQPYFPSWHSTDQLTFYGSLLPSNATTEGETIVFSPFDYGYADNKSNSDTQGCSIKIDWSVDSLGNPANLDTIHFIRIQTGVLFTNSLQTGEQSTEISAINIIQTPQSLDQISADTSEPVFTCSEIIFKSPLTSPAEIYTISGQYLTTIPLGTECYPIFNLPRNAIFLLRTNLNTYRFSTGN